MKVLLTGATGFLGFRTLEILVRDPRIKKIVATGRSLKKSHEVYHDKVNYILGNLEELPFVKELFIDIDYVINAAALSSPWGTKEMFDKANILTQKNLIEVSLDKGVKNFVFISTPSLYFEFKDRFNVKEDDDLPKKLINSYAETKRDAELLLINSGLSHVILRPRAIIGRGDTVIMPRLIRAFDEGHLKIIGNGKNVVDLTSAENISNAILLSLFANNNALNQTYNITNGEPIALWGVIADVLKQLDRKPPIKKIPFKVVKVIASFLELKARLINKNEPPITKYSVGILAKSLTLDISKAKRLLNYNPTVSTQEAILEFTNWYKSNERK